MASAAVSAAVSEIKYDVFVNFRGKDTRNNFTSHLLAALKRNGIDAFTDKGLKGGEEISTTLSNKISESQVSVVIFSQNYADSRCCLDELVRIMQCMEANSQTVLPVFLQGVEPTHVRNQAGAFGKAFGRLLEDGRFADKVKIWRRADLTGWDSNEISEAKIVEKLLKRIRSALNQMSLDDSDKLFVRIECVKEVESCLSSPKIKCLGIWGMGGSGKTTLVKRIYDRMHKNFERSCFIENVVEFAERQKLNCLHRSLLYKLIGKHESNEGSRIIFDSDIRRKLRRKRVLVILDDISDEEQIMEVIGNCNFYHPESKIIATSEDKQVLLKYGCDHVYEVQKLNMHESMQLLKFYSFKQRQPTQEQMELLEAAIKYAEGLPLALVVLGRNLFDKDIAIWKNELAKLSDNPNSKITKILRTSYDGLEDNEKIIFLDIACLLHGWGKDQVESILDACGFYAISGIARLVDKALVTISNNIVQMHYLVRQMGQHIAFHETDKPSRLWKNKDVVDFLTKNQDTEWKRKVEVISMDLSKGANINLQPRVFKKMTMLRILQFRCTSARNIKIFLPHGLKYLPNTLRYLEWQEYPLPSLPPQFNPENLVELLLDSSNLRQLWTDENEPCLPNLKYVNLSSSRNLTTLPNFKKALKLQELSVCYCTSLKDIPDSIQHLVELKCIYMHGNKSLERFPKMSQLTKLETLWLPSCSKIRNLPQLPPNLIGLDLSDCKKLKNLPDNLHELKNLKWFLIKGCSKIKTLPQLPQDLTLLNLSGTKIKELPPSVQGISQLEKLVLDHCDELERLPDIIGDGGLKNLPELFLFGCSKLLTLPTSINRLSSLMQLTFPNYKGDALPPLKGLLSLEELELDGSNLKNLPDDIKHLTNLKIISLCNCKSLSLIPELPPCLEYLYASNCLSLKKYTQRSLQEVLGRSLNFSIPECLRLTFVNCFKLKQDAIREIWREFLLSMQFILSCLLTKRLSRSVCISGNVKETYSERLGIAAIPGNEVSEWFKYSHIGSSLRVDSNFLRSRHAFGLIFGAAVDIAHNLNPCQEKFGSRNFYVACNCLFSSGEKLHSENNLSMYFAREPIVLYQRTHTIIWCDHFGLSEFDFNGAIFQFSVQVWDFDKWIVLEDEAIMKCGVTPIEAGWFDNSSIVKRGASLPKRSRKRKSASDDEQKQPISHKSMKMFKLENEPEATIGE